MARKRSPEYDFICRRCLCACDSAGTRHVSGGSRNFRSCGRPPIPVLRKEFEREIAADVAMLCQRMHRNDS